MRAHLSEQDLTDYALNELEPHQRIYVESLLAVSEECRNDVYRMIEMAQLLEQGFEREAAIAVRDGEDLHLHAQQRAHLTRPHHTVRYFFRDVASAIGLAACVAFCLVKVDQSQFEGARVAAGRVAQASTKAAGVVASAAQTPDGGIDLGKALASLRELAAESSSRLIDAGGDMLPEPPTICTPPTRVMESAQLTSFGDMP
jgi:anti-sigma factor RsiW